MHKINLIHRCNAVAIKYHVKKCDCICFINAGFVLSWLYVLCWIYILYPNCKQGKKYCIQHENAWVRLHRVDLRLKGVGSHFSLFVIFTFIIFIYKSHNLSTKNERKPDTPTSDQKEGKNKFHHSSNILTGRDEFISS